VQKSALSNFQLVLQHPQAKVKLAGEINMIAEVRLFCYYLQMLIRAFEKVDSYTMMSLSDVITQACSCFKESAIELAKRVINILVQYLQHTSAEN